MNDEELLVRAKELYNTCPTPKPEWEQLGDVTKSVWFDYAVKEMLGLNE